MSITITITVPDDLPATTSKQAYLATCMAAIGYAPMVRATGVVPELGAPYGKQDRQEGKTDIYKTFIADAVNPAPTKEEVTGDFEQAFEAKLQAESVMSEPSVQKTVAKRERGKPDPASGRSRRSKEEIAEDAAADAADAARAAERGNISTDPENREPPADEEEGTVNQAVDDAATTAQDEADEAAEQARLNAAKPAGALTLDDLRKAMGDVGKKHGIALAAKLPGYFGAFAQLEESRYADVIDEMKALLHVSKEEAEMFLSGGEEKPAEPAATEKAKTIKIPPGTRQQLIEAMFSYAEFADGTRDVDSMTHTMADLPIVFKEKFGVEAQADIPEDKLGEAIAAVKETQEKDRFKRKRG